MQILVYFCNHLALHARTNSVLRIRTENSYLRGQINLAENSVNTFTACALHRLNANIYRETFGSLMRSCRIYYSRGLLPKIDARIIKVPFREFHACPSY